jgi:uncharacterized protein
MTHSPEILEAARQLNVRPETVQTYLDAAHGPTADAERAFHTTIKAIGSACNLDCAYCYYLSKEKLLDHDPARRLADEALERFVSEYIGSQEAPEVAFTWHGGEPTLLGLRFFRKVVELQRKYAPKGRSISNDLQTNGTLLDDEWGEFLAENRFLVGISLDGPEALHDVYRPTKKGRPSFRDVMNGVRVLQRHGITFSCLTTVNRRNAKEPLAVYRFLRDEVGTRHVQFIPCVEPRVFETTTPMALPDHACAPADSPRGRPGHPLSVVTDWSVEPEDWGRFLAAVFDEWHANDQGNVVVNLFESMFAQLAGKPSLMCTSSPVCGKNVALEHDGRVYSCDHFVYPEHEIGKLGERTLAEMVFSLKQLEFGLHKHNSLPTECRQCEYLKLCWGECPRTRIHRTRPDEGNLSYLCQGWKEFFAHVVPRAERIVRTRQVISATSLVRNR